MVSPDINWNGSDEYGDEDVKAIGARRLAINGEVGFRGNWKRSRFERWDEDNYLEYIFEDYAFSDCVSDSVHCLRCNKVVSRPLKELLEPLLEDQVQFLPLKMRDEEGNETRDDYYLMHLLLELDCLDFERTHMKPPIGDDLPYLDCREQEVTLRLSAIPREAKIFTLAKTGSSNAYVRGDIADALLASGFTGIVIYDVKLSK